MKSRLKKLLSVVLAVSICASMVVVPSAASDDSVPLYADSGIQIVEDQIDASGNPITVRSADGDVIISKTLTPTEKENIFDITLNIQTDKSIKEKTEQFNSAVVIVMDVSNTMNSNNRLVNAKNAAWAFVQDFYADASDVLGSSRTLGLVTFNSNAQTVQPLVSKTEKTLDSWNTTIYNDVTAPSGTQRFTNIQAGLQLGYNQLNTSSATHKYLILLTDGFPTTYINGSATSTTYIAGYDPRTFWDNVMYHRDDPSLHVKMGQDPNSGGPSYSDTSAIKARETATAIKNAGIKIFSVGIDIGPQTIAKYDNVGVGTVEEWCPYRLPGDSRVFWGSIVERNTTNYEIGSATDKSAYENWLGNSIASGKTDYYRDGSTNMKGVYQYILSQIRTTNENFVKADWVVADPMPGEIDFLGFYPTLSSSAIVDGPMTGNAAVGGANEASFSNNAINWDLKKSGYTMTKVGSVDYYSYTLKYQVRLQNELTTFIEGQRYNTNNTTKLNYSKVTVVNNKETKVPQTLTFKVPAVKGYLTDLTLTKVEDGTNTGLKGAKFTLAHDKTVCGCGVDISNKVSGETGADGKITISGIPSGHKYTLQETTPPVGYNPSSTIYSMTVTYDAIKQTNLPSGYKIPNAPKTTNITVTKIWSDGDNIDKTRPANITVNLYANGGAEPVRTATVTGTGNEWTYTFEDLPTHSGGKEITYTVDEAGVRDDYNKDINGFVITNSYTPVPESVNWTPPAVSKTLDGQPAGGYQFQLKEGSTVIETVTSGSDGMAAFAGITYHAADAGTHTYTISEVNSGVGGITYDTTVYTVEVSVTADQYGKCKLGTVTYKKGSTDISAPANLTFANTTDTTSIPVTKV